MGGIWLVADVQAAPQATEGRHKILDAAWSWAAPSRLLEGLCAYVGEDWPGQGTRFWIVTENQVPPGRT